jgi:CheY-like chemotaxis protein
VLVVDDVETNLDVALALLQPYGLTVDCVSSGRQAVTLIQDSTHRYDCIFMDHMMPEIDGIEAVRIIRNEIDSDYARSVPIVAMTANALVGNEQLFLRSGFQAFLSKPIDLNMLDLILNRWIKDRIPGPEARPGPAGGDGGPEGSPASAEEPGGPAAAEDSPGGEDRRRQVSEEILRPLNTLYIDGIDMVKGLARYEGKESVYVPLLRSFVRHAPLMLEDLRRPRADNLANYAIRVHGLKGAAAGINADKLAALALELEMAAKKPDLALVQRLNDGLMAAGEILVRELSLMLRGFPLASEEEGRAMRLRPDPGTLSALMKACQTFRNNDIQRHLKNLEAFAYENDGDLIAWLRDQADNIEYDLIYERLSAYLSEHQAPDPSA